MVYPSSSPTIIFNGNGLRFQFPVARIQGLMSGKCSCSQGLLFSVSERQALCFALFLQTRWGAVARICPSEELKE